MLRLAKELRFRTVEEMQDALPPATIQEWLAFQWLENEDLQGDHG